MKIKKYSVFVCLLFLSAVTLLSGCSTIVLFDPKGPIGESERFVIITAAVLMAIVVVPVFIMAFLIPRKYRASNTAATYLPKWCHSVKIELFMWGGPIAIVMLLAILAWTRTHSLDPYKPIPSASQPLTIEAVCLDWKWLFIYPDQNIATVNQITFPVKVPLSFKLTSDTVMGSFFIPQLGSQIYAMAGMQTQLNLLADKPGVYAGQNQQLTGLGFADMHFQAIAVSLEEFQSWVQRIRQSPEKLDMDRYEQLARQTVGYPVTYYSEVKPELFDDIMRKYDPTWGKNHCSMSRGAVSSPAGNDMAEGK
ncbi:MAG TPA: ubiquinol oxidase subunit II [Desulfomonilia bacterium]|nr:ubiquinol oxidase subunit II [Desulfomonilia bacterium]